MPKNANHNGNGHSNNGHSSNGKKAKQQAPKPPAGEKKKRPARQKSSKPTRRKGMGALPPTEGIHRFQEQSFLANIYRNNLVRSELDRRAEAEKVLRKMRPHLKVIDAEVKALEDEVKAEAEKVNRLYSERGSRRATDEERRPCREARARLEAARDKLKAERLKAYAAPDVKTALEPSSKAASKRANSLRGEARKGTWTDHRTGDRLPKLWWGNYLLIEQAARHFGKGPPPKFKLFGEEASIGVPVANKGMLWSDVLADKCKVFRLVDAGRSRGGRLSFKVAWIRAGSMGPGGRQPLWIKVPVVFHPEIMPTDVLKGVTLHRRRIGPRYVWQVQLVLERETGWAKPDLAREGTLSVDLGWRQLRNGNLRVAAVLGSDGFRDEWVITAKKLARWGYARELASKRDHLFNWAVAELASFLSQNTVPTWLTEETKHLGQWRGKGRLATLLYTWQGCRFPGDESIFLKLWGRKVTGSNGKDCYEGWYLQDRHLWVIESSVRAKASRWRNYYYRKLAADFCRRYHTVRLEDVNWREMMEDALPEDATTENLVANRNQRIASPGILSTYLEEAFAKTVRVKAAGTTQTCAFCGGHDAFNAAKELVRRCRHCGERQDQDARAADNIMASTDTVS